MNLWKSLCFLGLIQTIGGQYSDVVNYDTHWPNGGSSWSFLGHCAFQLTQAYSSGSLPIDIVLDRPTSNIQVWSMNSIGYSGYTHHLVNKYNESVSATLTISFIVDYTGDGSTYPTGVCQSPSGTTSSTTTPTTTTTTPTTTTTTPTTTTTTNAISTAHDYKLVLEKSILFYEAQRSGSLPSNNRIPWRGDSALGDSGLNGRDLSGGWYDAGDYVKFNLPLSHSVTTLAIGLMLWKDAYESANQLDYMYESIEWPLDYLIKCWDATNLRYYAQVGNGDIDHAYWGRPEDMTMSRPAYYIENGDAAGDVTGGTVAALAAGALAFSEDYPSYSQTLLSNAESLYTFAQIVPGTYNSAIVNITKFYESTEYRDEMCLAAALLYMATNNAQYKTDAINHYTSYNPQYTSWSYDWDTKTPLCQALLYHITGDSSYKTKVEDFVTSYMPSGTVPYTGCGLAFRLEWAPNRYSANAAFIALLAADLGIGDATTYKTWAMSQIHYMLGDNDLDLSYVIGYSSNYPQNPHHCSSSCPWPSDATCSWYTYWNVFPNTHVLEGALIGGPDVNDDFPDDRNNFQTNEVACDYNAGLQSTVAALQHFAINNNLPAAPTPNC